MSLVLRRTVLTFVAAASVAGAGLVHAQASAPQAPAVSTAASGGTVAELQQLLAQKRLTELRTTYNGDYGTSLLLSTKTPQRTSPCRIARNCGVCTSLRRSLQPKAHTRR